MKKACLCPRKAAVIEESYKNHRIFVSSARVLKADLWVPRVELLLPVAEGVTQKQEIVITFTFQSEGEADQHALEKAKRLVDSRLDRPA